MTREPKFNIKLVQRTVPWMPISNMLCTCVNPNSRGGDKIGWQNGVKQHRPASCTSTIWPFWFQHS
jgi:hypothetical protein